MEGLEASARRAVSRRERDQGGQCISSLWLTMVAMAGRSRGTARLGDGAVGWRRGQVLQVRGGMAKAMVVVSWRGEAGLRRRDELKLERPWRPWKPELCVWRDAEGARGRAE